METDCIVFQLSLATNVQRMRRVFPSCRIQPTQISVINTLGIQVWSAAPSAIGNTNTFINTQTLASGIYYIHVQFKDAMQIQKIIIE